MINHAEQGVPKTNVTWKIMAAAASLPQFIAKADPTPASKLAFVIATSVKRAQHLWNLKHRKVSWTDVIPICMYVCMHACMYGVVWYGNVM